MSDIFISYARQDQPVAKELADAFANYGWSVFWDRQIPIGKTWDRVIESELIAARCVIVLWSHESVTHDWVRLEAEEGLKRRVLLPVTIEEGVDPPLRFRLVQAARLVVSKEHAEGIESTEAFTVLLPAISALAPRTHLSGFWRMRSQENNNEITVLRIAEASVPGTISLQANVYRDGFVTGHWTSTAVSLDTTRGDVHFSWIGARLATTPTFSEGTGRLQFDIASVPTVAGAAILTEMRVGGESKRWALSLERCYDEETRCLIRAEQREVSALVRRWAASKNAG